MTVWVDSYRPAFQPAGVFRSLDEIPERRPDAESDVYHVVEPDAAEKFISETRDTVRRHAEKVLEIGRRLLEPSDEDYERACRHEAGHALMALACQFDVEYCDANTAETRVHEPDNFFDKDWDDRHWQRSLVFAGAAALSGQLSQHEYNSDRYQAREHGDGRYDEAVKYIQKYAGDPDVRDLYERICDALREKGRLERGELIEIWNGS